MNYAFLRFFEFKEKAFTLSYDDGVSADIRLIDIMRKNQLKGTFNINSGMFALKSGENRLMRKEIIPLYIESGNEIAVHGAKHLPLAEVDRTLALNDVLSDRKELESLIKAPVRGMAYAFGSFNSKVVDLLKICGINYARTTLSSESFSVPDNWLMWSPTCHHKNTKLKDLAKVFVESKPCEYYWRNNAKIFYLWGHSYEFDNDDNWDLIEDFANYIGKRDDIWYASNGEIFDYIQAYNRLEFGVNSNFVFNPSAIDIYINYFGKEYIVPKGALIYLD